MRYKLLLFLLMLLTCTARSQQYDEVEFEVKKSKLNRDAIYFYRIANDILSLPSSSYNSYAMATRHNDTTTFYRLTSIPISRSDSLPKVADSTNVEMKFNWYYNTASDTVYMYAFNEKEIHTFPAFCINKPISTEPIFPSLWMDYYSGISQISITARNVIVTSDNTKYSCIKLQILRRVPYGKSKTVEGEHVEGKRDGYQVIYCYLRSSDYLLVKAQATERMKAFDSNVVYPIKTLFELYKAIE